MNQTLLITVDLGQLRAYRVSENENSTPSRARVIEAEYTDVSKHLSSIVTDRSGRFHDASSRSGAHDRTDSQSHNLSLERRERALKYIATLINRLVLNAGLSQWHLAADLQINKPLIDALDKVVRSRLQKNVPKNLAHLGVEDVLSHFYEPQPLSIISEANGGQNQARHQNNQLRSGNKRQTSAVVRELKRLKNPRASSTRSNGATVEQINRRNSRRKPSARRTSPFKKMMRRQKISLEVAQAMRGQPDKGDRRRTAAQRRVQEKYAARHRAVKH